jgi:hypothetical protein
MRLQRTLLYNTDAGFVTVHARQNDLTGALLPLIKFSLAYSELGFRKQSISAIGESDFASGSTVDDRRRVTGGGRLVAWST